MPANSPSFFAQILIAIPANPNPKSTTVIPISFNATMVWVFFRRSKVQRSIELLRHAMANGIPPAKLW